MPAAPAPAERPSRPPSAGRGRRSAARCAAVAVLAAVGAWLATGAAAAPAAGGGWRPSACPPLAETGTGSSDVQVTGPCGFRHRGDAECEAPGDDMLVIVSRKGRKPGTEVMLYVNVERYVGPGTYRPPNDIWVSLKDGSRIYRWYTRQFEVVVGPGSAWVELKDAQLEPELLLVGCTGPQTNYQCDGRGDDPNLMKTMTYVSGRIACSGGRPIPGSRRGINP